MAAIKGAAEILDETVEGKAQSKFVSNISEQSNRIQSTIEQMLALATIEKTDDLSQKGMVSVDALVNECISAKQHKAETKSCEIKLEASTEDCQIYGDARLISIAIENLLDNAIDFSIVGNPITVTVRNQTESSENDMCCISIFNTGPEVPDYAVEKIFERFYSLPRPNGGSKSSGLGLSFVREIAKLHDGRIQLENKNNGVLALLTLPISAIPSV